MYELKLSVLSVSVLRPSPLLPSRFLTWSSSSNERTPTTHALHESSPKQPRIPYISASPSQSPAVSMVLQTLLQRSAVSVSHAARRSPPAAMPPLSLRYTGRASAIYHTQLLSDSARFFSSGKGADDAKKELSPYQKLQKWMQPFVDGGKALYHENKQAWAIRNRLKSSGGDVQLSRQEMMVLRQAHRDLIKSLPLLLFFAVPLVGYAAPLIGYQFPKQLLPWQFWRPDQKTQFFREDARARASFYPELVQILQQIDNKEAVLKELLAQHKDDGTKRHGLNPVQVTELCPFFDGATDGPAALPQLSRHHVHVLARSIALVPAFSWAWQLVPRPTLDKFLERRIEELRVDDAMLLKEGIESLSLSELEFACEERGIVDGYGTIETLRRELGDWLSMYSTDNGVTPGQFPTALLLHAPALMNPTGRQD